MVAYDDQSQALIKGSELRNKLDKYDSYITGIEAKMRSENKELESQSPSLRKFVLTSSDTQVINGRHIC